MCHKVSNNRPPVRVEQPQNTPAAVSPERGNAQIQSANPYNNTNDSFEGNRLNKCEAKKAEKLFKKLEKIIQKLEQFMPQIGQFLRDMINSVKKEQTPDVQDVADRVPRRAPQLPAPVAVPAGPR